MNIREKNDATVAAAAAKLSVAFANATWNGKKAVLLREMLEDEGFTEISPAILNAVINVEIKTCPYHSGPTIAAIVDEYRRTYRRRQKELNARSVQTKALPAPTAKDLADRRKKMQDLKKRMEALLGKMSANRQEVVDDPEHMTRVKAQVEQARKEAVR